MITNTIGWIACIDGSVLRTTDGGLTWADVTSPDVLALTQPGMDGSLFLDSTTAWITVLSGSTSYSFHTTDAGKTWQQGTLHTNEPMAGGGFSYQLSATSPQEAWAVEAKVGGAGPGGAVEGLIGPYHTTDGGKTWAQVPDFPALHQLNYSEGVAFADQQTGIIVGSATTTSRTGSVERTQDYGDHWQNMVLQSRDPARWQVTAFFSPQFLTHTDAVFFATLTNTSSSQNAPHFGFTVFYTRDGSMNWSSSAIIDTGAASISDTKFFTAQQGYALIRSNTANQFTRFTTNDGGEHWNHSQLQIPGAATTAQQQTPVFLSLTTGWLLPGCYECSSSQPTSLYTTTDGAQTWTELHAHFPPFITPQSKY